jgi:hypothetical protein
VVCALVNVSRGLLSTEARGLSQLGPADPDERTVRVIGRLRDAPAGDFSWKERAQWAARLSRGDGDERGRRLFSEAGRMDARYVARISRRALRGELPDGKQWGNLRESLRRIFIELGGAA